jgi:hypothetical protein
VALGEPFQCANAAGLMPGVVTFNLANTACGGKGRKRPYMPRSSDVDGAVCKQTWHTSVVHAKTLAPPGLSVPTRQKSTGEASGTHRGPVPPSRSRSNAPSGRNGRSRRSSLALSSPPSALRSPLAYASPNSLRCFSIKSCRSMLAQASRAASACSRRSSSVSARRAKRMYVQPMEYGSGIRW